MPGLNDLEVGVMFWLVRDDLRTMKEMGVRCGQLGVGGDADLSGLASKWKADLEREQFQLVTIFCGYNGEDYADIPTVQRTVGWIPPASRAEREARTLEVSDFGAALGVPSVALHVGFVPEDKTDPDYIAVREMVRRVADHAAKNHQTFALETGQEPAHVLLDFIHDVGRENVGINFDPANMILYGTGDPIEALGVLGHKLLSVHVKDGDWPPKDKPGALGTERPLGQGAVGMERYIAKLKEVGFRGPLNIERETEDQQTRLADMRMAVTLLKGLRG
jgi:sugar phosphate isomerase/epimerase